jgi:hypothetical protein
MMIVDAPYIPPDEGPRLCVKAPTTPSNISIWSPCIFSRDMANLLTISPISTMRPEERHEDVQFRRNGVTM